VVYTAGFTPVTLIDINGQMVQVRAPACPFPIPPSPPSQLGPARPGPARPSPHAAGLSTGAPRSAPGAGRQGLNCVDEEYGWSTLMWATRGGYKVRTALSDFHSNEVQL
jgi:hypothetical protein